MTPDELWEIAINYAEIESDESSRVTLTLCNNNGVRHSSFSERDLWLERARTWIAWIQGAEQMQRAELAESERDCQILYGYAAELMGCDAPSMSGERNARHEAYENQERLVESLRKLQTLVSP